MALPPALLSTKVASNRSFSNHGSTKKGRMATCDRRRFVLSEQRVENGLREPEYRWFASIGSPTGKRSGPTNRLDIPMGNGPSAVLLEMVVAAKNTMAVELC
jgi:hypothetical protein